MLTSFGMRFGVLGPANGDLAALEEGASLLLFEHHADEVIYLGPDDALDRLVLEWAGRLVGGDPSENGIWDRAAQRAARPGTTAIDRFVAAERKRERLEALKCLPAATAAHRRDFRGAGRGVSLRQGAPRRRRHLAGLVAGLWQEPVALVRQVGSRTFISPGEIGQRQKWRDSVRRRSQRRSLTCRFYRADGGTWLESHLRFRQPNRKVPRARQASSGDEA